MSKNVFESGLRKVIPAVLIYVRNAQNQLLMLHRNAKADDFHEGKWNGLGGKCDPDESPWQTASRELEEEAGLKILAEQFHWLGTLQFPNFKPQKSEDWLVFVLTARLPDDATPWKRGPEGDLVWVDASKVLELNLWEGDRFFLPSVLGHEPFFGTIWYEGKRVRNKVIQRAFL